jgi:hypothetical protein
MHTAGHICSGSAARSSAGATGAALIWTRLLSSVALVAFTAALVCGAGGPAAVIVPDAAQAIPFVRPPPATLKPVLTALVVRSSRMA